MQKTDIAWTTFTSNPIKFRRVSDNKVVWACVKCSTGCHSCYAEQIALRFDRGKLFTAANMEEVRPFLDEDELRQLLTRKTCGGVPVSGSRVFIADMTDAFGEWIPDEMLDRLFAVVALRPDVTFQVLTKRAERMAAYFGAIDRDRRIKTMMLAATDKFDCEADFHGTKSLLPLKNCWLGVSVENQTMADERIPHLLRTPAAVRFLSVEPMLGAVDAWRYLVPWSNLAKVDWVIIGCESNGPRVGRLGEFKSESEWWDAAFVLVEQCRAAGTVCFVKQGPSSRGVVHDLSQFPESCRVQEFPEAKVAA